ncbi:MAG: hypothetical protein E7271_03280 [Lachnospiraceae bacterium]|jgi:hypothetical protein|nr:hypothetical protein [Lachnospiraceae bacterium]
MGLTVYLSNTDIEVLRGQSSGKNVTVNQVHFAEMPEGSFLNGVITDPEGLEYALTSLWNRTKLPRKGIRLVINTPQISVRVLDMPIMSHAKAATYLQREFEERSGERKRLLGFYVIGKDNKKKTMKVCTEIADVDFVANYVSVFEAAGITLKEINSGIGVSVNFLKKMKFASNTNSVVMLRDGMTVTAIYFVNGEYFYSTTTRTFNNPGTVEFAGEIAGTVSQIEQFSKSEKVEDSISEIYLAGMTSDDAINVERAVAMNMSEGMKVHNLDKMKGISYRERSYSLNDLFYPTAGLMQLSDHRNLLKMYGKGSEVDEEKRERALALSIPHIAVFAIMLVITLSRAAIYSNRKAQLKELEEYNMNPTNLSMVAEYDESSSKVQGLSDHVNALRLLENDIESFPMPLSTINKVIVSAVSGLGEVTIDSYNSNTGTVGITATFNDVETINTFIERLEAQDCFYEINYTGYSEINSSGQWVANLECILAENAGR